MGSLSLIILMPKTSQPVSVCTGTGSVGGTFQSSGWLLDQALSPPAPPSQRHVPRVVEKGTRAKMAEHFASKHFGLCRLWNNHVALAGTHKPSLTNAIKRHTRGTSRPSLPSNSPPALELGRTLPAPSGTCLLQPNSCQPQRPHRSPGQPIIQARRISRLLCWLWETLKGAILGLCKNQAEEYLSPE